MTKSLMVLIGVLLLGLGALSPFIANSSDPPSETENTNSSAGVTTGSDNSSLTGQNSEKKADSTHPLDTPVVARRVDTIRVASLVLPCGGGIVLLVCLFGSTRTDPDRFSTWLFTASLAMGLVGFLMFILALERANEISTNHAVLNLFLSAALCFLFVGFVGLVRLGSQSNDSEVASTS